MALRDMAAKRSHVRAAAALCTIAAGVPLAVACGAGTADAPQPATSATTEGAGVAFDQRTARPPAAYTGHYRDEAGTEAVVLVVEAGGLRLRVGADGDAVALLHVADDTFALATSEDPPATVTFVIDPSGKAGGFDLTTPGSRRTFTRR